MPVNLAQLAVLCWGMLHSGIGFAEESLSAADLESRLSEIQRSSQLVVSSFGVTGKGTPLRFACSQEDLDLNTKKTRILLVAGFEDSQGTELALNALKWFYVSDQAKDIRERFTLSAVPLLNPDGASPPNFPPKGDAYNSRQNTEAEYLWRWVGMHAPDLVVGITTGTSAGWKTSAAADQPAGKLVATLDGSSGNVRAGQSVESLNAMNTQRPCDTGTIPALTGIRTGSETNAAALLKELIQAIEKANVGGPSEARQELQRRLDRTPLEIASQLAQVYGHDLSSVEYIPALALVGRLWLGELTKDPSHRTDVERIVSVYADGKKPALPAKFNGSHLAGHLIFTELARTAKDPSQKETYLKLACLPAETGFDDKGQPKPSMPAHNEMSDAIFMGCPILVEAGVQTGEAKYLDMAVCHFEFMRPRVLRADGIYRHSPLCETAWGRGNGFPALGLAWSLSALPKDHSAFRLFLKEFRQHMAALVKLQDADGMWHQVIDDPASYRELSCTCMITFAMIRGVRAGWLEEATYRPIIEKAFTAIKTRIAPNGTLFDVCTGTGKQKTLRDYYDRNAILGRDARGGAMSLLVTTEMAHWQRETNMP